MAKKEEPRKIPVKAIKYRHSPDKRGERKDAHSKKPIDVRPLSGGGYKVVDGNDRLYYARQRGDTHIQAVVGKPLPFLHWD